MRKKNLSELSKGILERHDETDTRAWLSALRLWDSLCVSTSSPAGSKAARAVHRDRVMQQLRNLTLPQPVSDSLLLREPQ
eukprot:2761179-Pyramimonas_sp.AAC.1